MINNDALYGKLKQGKFLLIGPCAIASEALVMQVANIL